jgi:hypothetical protein
MGFLYTAVVLGTQEPQPVVLLPYGVYGDDSDLFFELEEGHDLYGKICLVLPRQEGCTQEWQRYVAHQFVGDGSDKPIQIQFADYLCEWYRKSDPAIRNTPDDSNVSLHTSSDEEIDDPDVSDLQTLYPSNVDKEAVDALFEKIDRKRAEGYGDIPVECSYEYEVLSGPNKGLKGTHTVATSKEPEAEKLPTSLSKIHGASLEQAVLNDLAWSLGWYHHPNRL